MPDEVKKDTNEVEEKQPEELSASEQTQDSTEELTSEASDRTREQFEKLKAHNKELSDKLRQLEGSKQEESVFDSLRPKAPSAVSLPNLSQQQIDDAYAKMVDENGYVDQNLLIQKLREANEQAAKATAAAERTRQEFERMQENEQAKTAHKLFPQLDPRSVDFDPKFYEAVRDRVIGMMVKDGSKNLVQAAQDVSQWFPLKRQEAKKETGEESVKKIQASAPSPGATKMSSDYDDLVRRTQRGDSSALMERLKRAGY